MATRAPALSPVRAIRPGLVVVVGFGVTIGVGTLILLLPSMTPGPEGPSLIQAAFTATSAVTVTGLATVDTATAWTGWGQAVILALIQIGGLGMAVTGTLLVQLIGRRLGLRSQLIAQAETPGLTLGEVLTMVRFILLVTVAAELVAATVLTLRWWSTYDQDLPTAAWNGLFHSVSAFNNAGFSTFSDNLIGFRQDPVILIVIMLLIVGGGLGFPIWYHLRKVWRTPRRWSIHARLTIGTTIALLLGGWLLFCWFEWTNPATLGAESTGNSLLNGLFASVTARTAGFNTFDYGDASQETILTTSGLMFIGGGSASTAGGIKVTTFVIVALMAIAEARGDQDINTNRRRISEKTQRAAVAIITAYTLLLFTALLLLSAMTEFRLANLLLESVSAIATVGLSTGITPDLPSSAQWVLIGLMFIGRLGAMTMATAFALRSRPRQYRLPEGRPIVG